MQKSNLWLLIQDPSGNELDWLKLQAGEKVPINHFGALTLTCSSGKEIDIFNKAGKKWIYQDWINLAYRSFG